MSKGMHLLAMIFGLLVIAVQPARAASQAQIGLAEHVRLDRETVRLGDVASISTHDLALLRRLMALPLASLHSATKPLVLTRPQIEARLRSELGSRLQLKWTDVSRVGITPASSQIYGSEILMAAREALRRWLAQHHIQEASVIADDVRDVLAPPGRVQLLTRPLASDKALSERVLVWVDIWADERFIRTIGVSFAVTAKLDGFVSTPNIHTARNTLYAPEQQLNEDRPLNVKSSDATQAQWQSSVNSPKHTVQHSAQLKNQPIVMRGQMVTAVAASVDLSVEMKMEALQDGAKGQWIQVKPMQSGALMQARVLEAGRVELMP
jgi:flagellar basal body P-ring formation protein FlgA